MNDKQYRSAVVCDANILIDFKNCDGSLVSDLGVLFKMIYVPYLVLYEVRNLTEKELIDLGVKLVETPLSVTPKSGLSTADWACFLTVKEVEGACITNDMKLRSYCAGEGYKVFWGLETLVMMYKEKIINRSKAYRCGKIICDRNPFINEDLKKQYISKLGK